MVLCVWGKYIHCPRSCCLEIWIGGNRCKIKLSIGEIKIMRTIRRMRKRTRKRTKWKIRVLEFWIIVIDISLKITKQWFRILKLWFFISSFFSSFFSSFLSSSLSLFLLSRALFCIYFRLSRFPNSSFLDNECTSLRHRGPLKLTGPNLTYLFKIYSILKTVLGFWGFGV